MSLLRALVELEVGLVLNEEAIVITLQLRSLGEVAVGGVVGQG